MPDFRVITSFAPNSVEVELKNKQQEYYYTYMYITNIHSAFTMQNYASSMMEISTSAITY